MNTDLFNSNNGGFRGVPTFPGSGVGLTTTNNVLISQASLINSGQQMKQGSGIGPIGTKAGAGGPGPSSPYLANLPNTNSNIFIQYDNSGNPLNPYIQGSAPHPPGRGSTPSQTAFYQSLAAANRQQQAFNALQGFNNQAAQHALSQQQLRANAVAGMPFLKTDQSAKSPVSISDSGFNAAVPPYNGGRSGGNQIAGQGGPPSPKTKLKMAQQEQAKLNANMNNLNLNNLNALAQMQRSMGLSQYNQHLGSLVQQGQYNPSPIARPQGGVSQGGTISTGAGAAGLMNKQNQFFTPEGVDAESSSVDDCGEKGSQDVVVEEEATVGQVDLPEQASQEVASAGAGQEQEA